MNIPDEALEATHKAWREQSALDGSIFEYNLHAALEAAAPHLIAGALRDAAAALAAADSWSTASPGTDHVQRWLIARGYAIENINRGPGSES